MEEKSSGKQAKTCFTKRMKKIVIIGPECTGKSTLSQQLAATYKTVWCPEFARQYLLNNGTNYTYDDLLTIAKGQIEQEDKLAHDNQNFYFIDTDMYVMKVWCEVVYNNCHTWILKQIANRRYDMYLLCDVDLPWVQDGMREYPDMQARQKLFTVYKELVINSGTKWALISGTEQKRLQTATSILNTTFLGPHASAD